MDERPRARNRANVNSRVQSAASGYPGGMGSSATTDARSKTRAEKDAAIKGGRERAAHERRDSDDAPRNGDGRPQSGGMSRAKRLLWSPVALVLVLLMAAGSILLWIGLPLGLIWIASMISDSSQPSMGPYLLILVGLPVGAIVIGKLLGMLDRMHGRVTGRTGGEQKRNTWMNSMGEKTTTNRRERSVLDTVMIVSVLSALVVGGIWFIVFAGSPLPS
jgi:hypothetical protein